MPSPARSLPFPAVLLALVLTGCAGGPQVRVATKEPSSQAWALAVYPVVFRFPQSPYEAHSRGRALAEHLSAKTGRAVYGPGEFRLDDPDADDLRRGTNLMGALKYSKARRPEGLYAVRAVVDRRVSRASSVTRDSAGRARGARRGEEEVELAVRLELLSLGERRVVAEVEGVAKADLFSEELEQDPLPDVTRLVRELADALVDATGLRAATPRSTAGLAVVAVPKPAMAFTFLGQSSLDSELAKLDALDKDSRLLSLFRQIDPAATRARIRHYRSAPHGLVVVAAEGPAKVAGLMPDDLVLAADGEAITGRHVLERHLAMGEVVLRVRRAGEDLELRLAP